MKENIVKDLGAGRADQLAREIIHTVAGWRS